MDEFLIDHEFEKCNIKIEGIEYFGVFVQIEIMIIIFQMICRDQYIWSQRDKWRIHIFMEDLSLINNFLNMLKKYLWIQGLREKGLLKIS